MDPHRGLRSIVSTWWRGVRRGRAERGRWRPVVEPLETRRLLASLDEFPIPTPHSWPGGIAAGPDDRLWFAENLGNKVASIDPMTGAFAEYTLPTADAEPLGIATGPDGQLWFTEFGANKIGSIDPFGRRFQGGKPFHALVEYAIPTAGSHPDGIAAGPDGQLWFTESGTNQIGSIDPTTHKIAEYLTPTGRSYPEGITAGPDGNLWFTEVFANQIGRIDPTTHVVTEFLIPTANFSPSGIAAGPDGQLWFAGYGGKVGAIDPVTGAITEYAITTTDSSLRGIAAGPDGLLWFTEFAANKIGAIDPSTHAITEIPLPAADSLPSGIAAGPDGRLWFTEQFTSNIGALAPPLELAVTAGPPARVAPGAAFGLTVSVEYQTGRVDSRFDGDITLALAPDSGGATLGGMTTVAAHNGVATFSGLTIDESGPGYRIEISIDRQTMAMTTPVTVGAPPTVATSPTIVAAAPVLVGKGRRKRLVGFDLDFSAAMDPARAAGAANYSLVQYRRRRHWLITQPVSVRASYDATAHRVELTLVGRPRFAAGGKLVVTGAAEGGLADAAGTPLGGDLTFVIARHGAGLSR